MIRIHLLTTLTSFALNGEWRGNLTLGANKLPLVFHFSEAEAEETRCVLDSPMQGVKGLETTVTFCNSDILQFIKSL